MSSGRKKGTLNKNGEQRNETYKKYNDRLIRVTNHLNSLYDEAEPLRQEYYKIMSYFRTQKSRGLISEEEYQEKVKLFKYLNKYTSSK